MLGGAGAACGGGGAGWADGGGPLSICSPPTLGLAGLLSRGAFGLEMGPLIVGLEVSLLVVFGLKGGV